MRLATQSTTIAFAMVMTFVQSQAMAQSANSTEAEIAALKKQLRLAEKKLDRLQKQTAAKTVATAKTDAKTEANAKASTDDANVVVPVNALPPGRTPSSKCRITGRRFAPQTNRIVSHLPAG
jgi:phosphate-selective porin OprO and OprP